jgi:serine/threonine-protein kinase
MVHPRDYAIGSERVAASDTAGVVDPGPDDALLSFALTRVGRTLRAKWRLDTLLGVGGMAAVYSATHRNGRRAAVKVLHPEMSVHPTVRERFLREGYVANAVGHPGAVHIIDDDSAEDGSLFLVTELLEGETLEERCVRLGGQLHEREVLVIVDRLLDVLAAAHSHGVIHRDVKPDNVFVTRAGQVKVLDFGVARLQELSPRKRLTETGLVMGTPAYMAPEHASGYSDRVDPRTDLWACGAVMYRLLTGNDVHSGGTMQEQLVSAMTKPAPALASVFPQASPAVAELVDRALAFDKSLRWPDAPAMQEALRRAYEAVAGARIDAAPSLTVDSSVIDRTRVARAEHVGRFSTAVERDVEPLETTFVRRMSGWSRRRWSLLAASAVLFVFAVVLAVFRVTRTPDARVLTSQPAPPPGTAAGGAPRQAPDPLDRPGAPPLVSVSDLPVAQEATRDEKKHGAAAASSSGANKVDCHPPYVVDGQTGKKRWKLECL